jgi:hypothetical protein
MNKAACWPCPCRWQLQPGEQLHPLATIKDGPVAWLPALAAPQPAAGQASRMQPSRTGSACSSPCALASNLWIAVIAPQSSFLPGSTGDLICWC